MNSLPGQREAFELYKMTNILLFYPLEIFVIWPGIKQNKNTTHRMEETLANKVTDKGLISKNMQIAHIAQYQNQNNPNNGQKI